MNIETEKIKISGTRQLQRIAALPYNPYFKQEVKNIQQKLQIPEGEGFEWFHSWYLPKYHKKLRPSSSKIEELIYLDYIASPESLRYDEFPLETETAGLLRRFELPLAMFLYVFRYVITENWLVRLPFVLDPDIDDMEWNIEDELTITISGIGWWTTKKQWVEIWDKDIKPELEKVGFVASRKRATLESYEEQMKRHSEWYQLVEIEGLPAGEALKQWELSHPEQVPLKGIDDSTVSKAVSEFRSIITPIR